MEKKEDMACRKRWFRKILEQDFSGNRDFPATRAERNLSFFRGLFIVLQTIAVSLIALLFWMPFNVYSYILGASVGIAVVFNFLVPRGERNFRYFRPYLPLLLLYCLFWISVFYSPDRAEAVQMCGRWLSFLLIPLVFGGMTSRFWNPKRLEFFSFCLIAGCLIEVLFRTVLLVSCFFTVPDLEPYRQAGFWPALNEFLAFQGIYMDFAGMEMLVHTTFEALWINLAFMLVSQAWIKRHRFFEKFPNGEKPGCGTVFFRKLLAILVLIAFSFTLLTSNSKVGQVLLVLTIAVLLIQAFRYKRYVFFWSVLSVIFMFFVTLVPYVGQGITGRIRQSVHVLGDVCAGEEDIVSDGSLLPRIYCWKTAAEMIGENPVFGIGVGNRSTFQKKFQENYPTYRRSLYVQPHNQFLAVLLSNGIIGFLFFLWFWVEAIRLVYKGRNLLWWIWLLGLFSVCMTDALFNSLLGLLYLCGFFCIQIVISENKNNVFDKPRAEAEQVRIMPRRELRKAKS